MGSYHRMTVFVAVQYGTGEVIPQRMGKVERYLYPLQWLVDPLPAYQT